MIETFSSLPSGDIQNSPDHSDLFQKYWRKVIFCDTISDPTETYIVQYTEERGGDHSFS